MRLRRRTYTTRWDTIQRQQKKRKLRHSTLVGFKRGIRLIRAPLSAPKQANCRSFRDAVLARHRQCAVRSERLNGPKFRELKIQRIAREI